MVSRKGNAEQSAREAGQRASASATPKTNDLDTQRKPQAGQVVTLRIDPVELDSLRRTFGSFGVPLATGIKISARHVMNELKAKRLDLSKAGLLPGERSR